VVACGAFKGCHPAAGRISTKGFSADPAQAQDDKQKMRDDKEKRHNTN